MNIGEIVRAKIEEVLPFGFYLSYEGERILVLLPEISWERVHNASDFGKVGDERDVVLLAYIKAHQHYMGSIKQVHPEEDPWREPSKFAEGNVFEGKVEMKADYGAFVSLAPHVWGLVHAEQGGKDLVLSQKVRVKVCLCVPENGRVELKLLETS